MSMRGNFGGGGGWRDYVRGEGGENAPSLTWPLLKRVFAYAKPHRRGIALLFVAILVTTALGLITPLIFRDLLDYTLPNRDTTRLNLLVLGLVIIPVMSGLIRVFQRKVNATIGEGVIYELRVSLYAHLQRMSLHFFTNTKTGELMSRLNTDVVGAQNAISNTLVEIVTNLITAIATLAVMLTLEWRLTLLGVMVLPLFIFAARRIGSELRDVAREQMDHNARMNAIMNETLNISGALLVKLFGRSETEIQRFEQRAGKVRDTGVRQAVMGGRFFMLLGMVSAMGTALVFWVGGHMYIEGTFTIGTIMAFSTFLSQLYGPLQALTNAPVAFAQSMVSFERVFEVIDLPKEIVEKPNALKLDQVRGELAFENVSFSYKVNEDLLLKEVTRHGRMDNIDAVLSDSAPTPSTALSTDKAEEAPHPQHQARDNALENLSFHIQPGQLIALVGPSGAGKTTMTYLVPRLYDPTSGRITLDGHDLRDLQLDSLAQQIGMVTQETFLFHDTVRTNLLYARLDATEEEIIAACKAANIHNFIMGLDDGYDTVVGERGYRLSGGEKQRIAIARVILKDPRILVLDEATSHLDSQSEALIQESLKTVQAGRTSIVIAHRLSTILAADTILVMDRGRIVEQGQHDQLLAMGGLYTQLYETQFSNHHPQEESPQPA